MPDPRDQLELTSGVTREPAPAPETAGSAPGSTYLRLWFDCSRQYARAQKSPDGTKYTARCPKCGATAKFAIGPGGTSERFFRVSC